MIFSITKGPHPYSNCYNKIYCNLVPLHLFTHSICLPHSHHYEHSSCHLLCEEANRQQCQMLLFTFNRTIGNAHFVFYQIYVCNGTSRQSSSQWWKSQRELTHLHIKTRSHYLIHWCIKANTDIQTTQADIFFILRSINCPSRL